MSAMTRDLKEDVRRDPRELERDADRARDDLERTLEALERRISPTALMDRTIRAVRENGGDFGRNLATQVRNNPLPAVLAGVGIAWLIAVNDRPPRARGRAERGYTEPLRERLSSAAATTREAAGEAASATRSAARHAASTTRSAGQGVAGASRSLRDTYLYMSREQPLTLGALAIAAGAALGAMMPSSETEDEWLGEASGETKERLKDEASESWEEAKTAAADAAERAAAGAEEGKTGAEPSASLPEREPGAPASR